MPAATLRTCHLGDWYTGTEVAGVYRATWGRHRRPVLIKLPRHPRQPTARQRLDREAAVLATIRHPHGVRLAATFGTADALVFDNLAGEPLRSAPLPLAPPDAVRLITQVLDCLQALHDMGLVHRDVRPENIWRDGASAAALANFELACPGTEHPAEPRGTLPYASPEQRRGEPIDARADLFATAVTLWELVTGQLPESAAAARAATPHLTPPPELASVLRTALRDDPAARPPSAHRFAAMLRETVNRA